MKRAVALLLGGLAGTPAIAGEISDAAIQAESLFEAGNHSKAFAALNKARELVWDAAPLTINKAVLVASDPQGFGIYDIRDDNRYRANEDIVIYTEPSGFAYGRDGDLYVIGMTLDFEVKSTNGESLASQENFAAWQLRSRVPNKEFMGKITYSFADIQPGDYIVDTRIRDLNSDKVTSFPTRITIIE
jgi:hypothetical protein